MDPPAETDSDSEEELLIAAAAVCAMAAAAVCAATLYYDNYVEKASRVNTYRTPRRFVKRVMQSDEQCHDLLRMNVECFKRFVQVFRSSGRLHDTIHCSIEEQVAIFLHTITHNKRVRTMKRYTNRSGETVGRYFNTVLDALLAMQDKFIKPPRLDTAHQILENPSWMPYFKDCIGAIDNTHIPVKVNSEYEARFRGPMHRPTQNVLAACDFDLNFTYVLAGWEGSASDSRVLNNALSREHKIICPPGKFYLADADYPLSQHFITPYQSERYHLNEIGGQQPETTEELFNQRHSSLRNVIERAFGLLKKRFGIICEDSMYSLERQIHIVMACCCVHNHIRRLMPDDALLDDVDRELQTQATECDDLLVASLTETEDDMEGSLIRTTITQEMWNDYQLSQQR